MNFEETNLTGNAFERGSVDVSVILVGDVDLPVSLQRVEAIQTQLATLSGSTRYAVYGLAGRCGYENRPDRFWPRENCDLGELLATVPTERLIIADVDFSFGVSEMGWLSAADDGRVYSVVERHSEERRILRRCLKWGVLTLQWALFGTRQTGWRAGAISGRSVDFTQAIAPGKTATQIAQLIGKLKTCNRQVVETEVGCLGSVRQPPSPLAYAGEAKRSLTFWWNEIKFAGQSQSRGQEDGVWGRPLWLWGLLILITWLVLSRNLSYPLFEPDEARNAQLAVNILQTGEWLSLRLADEPYWDKPPLVAWMTAWSYHWFGVSEMATRLPGNLMAFLTVLLTFGLGKKIVGTRPAWMAAICLVLSVGFVTCGRYVTMDSVLTCLAWSTLASAYLACRGPRFHWGWWTIASISGGMALLAKGPIVIVLTLPVLLIQHFLEGNRSLLDWRRWLVFSVPVVLIAAPWYLAMTIVHPDFFAYFFWKHHVLRFSEAFNHQEPWWYYIPVIFIAMFPASYLLPSLVKWLWHDSPDWAAQRSREVGFLVLAAGWVLAFFTLSEAKLPTYILPALPATVLLMGVMLEKRLFEPQGSRASPLASPWLLSVPAHASRVLAFLLLAGSVVTLLLGKKEQWSDYLILGMVLILGAALAWVAHGCLKRLQGQNSVNWLAVSALGLLTVGLLFQSTIPEVAVTRSVHLAAAQVRQQVGMPDLPIVFFEHEDYGARFWLHDQPVWVFDDDDRHKMTEFLMTEREALIVSRQEDIDVLARTLKWPLTITEVSGARRLFLCAEREPKTAEPRTASRLDDIIVTR